MSLSNLNKALNLLLVFAFAIVLFWIFIGQYFEIGINKIGNRIVIKADIINITDIPCPYRKIDNATVSIEAEVFKKRDGYLLVCNGKKILVKEDLVILIEKEVHR